NYNSLIAELIRLNEQTPVITKIEEAASPIKVENDFENMFLAAQQEYINAKTQSIQEELLSKNEAIEGSSSIEKNDNVLLDNKKSELSETALRVDINLLDKLMNLVGELVLARNQILQFTKNQSDTEFISTSQRLNLITSELQDGVM